jgi:hypothetical protein
LGPGKQSLLYIVLSLIFSLYKLTALDRMTGSTSLLMRCKGTVIPGSPTLPQYIKNHVYFPPAFLANNPNLEPWLRNVCQDYVEKVGVPTVADWVQHGNQTFGWSFLQRPRPLPTPQPNLVLPSTTMFPFPEPNTSRYIYPGQAPDYRPPAVPSAPPAPLPAAPSAHLPTSQTSSTSDAYPTDEGDFTPEELGVIDLHEQLALSKEERKLLSARIAFLEAENDHLEGRVRFLESGANLIATTFPISPHTPSKTANITPHPTPTRAQSSTPLRSQPHQQINVTINRPTPRQNSTPSAHPDLAPFLPPASQSGSLFQEGSSRNRNHHEQADRAPPPQPMPMLVLCLELLGLDELEGRIRAMLLYNPYLENLDRELRRVGVPAEFTNKIAKSIFLDQEH